MSTPEQTTEFYRYYTEHGADETAARLSQLLGKQVDKIKVQRFGKKRQPPKEWRDALRLEQPPGPGEGEAPEPQRAAETPPRPPEGARLLPPPAAITAQAAERIAALHVFAGSSIATAADPVGFQNGTGEGGGIAALWTDKSSEIAAAWIAWAEEGNKFAQSFVRLMGTGGAGGNLVLGYAALLGGTAYILGHLPDNDATRLVYGRYSRFRTVRPEPPADEADAAERPADPSWGQSDGTGNGTAPPGTANPLGGSAEPAR